MLTLTPVVCVLASIAFSVTLDNYIHVDAIPIEEGEEEEEREDEEEQKETNYDKKKVWFGISYKKYDATTLGKLTYCLTAVGMEPTPCGLLVQHSTNWAAKLGRSSWTNRPEVAGSILAAVKHFFSLPNLGHSVTQNILNCQLHASKCL